MVCVPFSYTHPTHPQKLCRSRKKTIDYISFFAWLTVYQHAEPLTSLLFQLKVSKYLQHVFLFYIRTLRALQALLEAGKKRQSMCSFFTYAPYAPPKALLEAGKKRQSIYIFLFLVHYLAPFTCLLFQLLGLYIFISCVPF